MRAAIGGVPEQFMGRFDRLSPVYQGLLLLLVVVCGLSVVTSQFQARKLFVELQRDKDQAQQMDVEWGQLQLEQSTWATPARVKKIAVNKLQMQLPKSGQIKFIQLMPDSGIKPQQ